MSDVERKVVAAIQVLGPISGLDSVLAIAAWNIALDLDNLETEPKERLGLYKELRATMTQLYAGRKIEEEEELDLGPTP